MGPNSKLIVHKDSETEGEPSSLVPHIGCRLSGVLMCLLARFSPTGLSGSWFSGAEAWYPDLVVYSPDACGSQTFLSVPFNMLGLMLSISASYSGRGGYLYEEDSCKTPTGGSNISESRHGLALKLIHEAAAKLEQQDGHEDREHIILVLDPEVQMLPWESIPILRKQEVYRMPSVSSISSVLKKHSLQGEPAISHAAAFPLIDPLDSFYLLNPGGDLPNTQLKFESWFRDQNFEGKAGSEPSAEELTEALKNHDLYLYLGHGSGAQYLSRQEIENLDKCSATFLMGCSSGSLWLKGCYIPQGVPLSYLLAGSPAIVANLWDVTDRDIDRFGKSLLEAWLRERSDSSSTEGGGCSHCESLANDNHSRRKIGSFIAAAREACTLPHLIGAAPVCYGVPTGITRKKGIEALRPSSSYC